MQISYLVSGVHYNTDNHGIMYSTDPDAGDGIHTALITTVFSGGHPAHGILYFKIAHYLSFLSPIFDFSLHDSEKFEKKVHYSLQIVSLLSMYLLTILLSYIITRDVLYSVFSIILLSSSILTNYAFTIYIFRAHPDMLLSLFSGCFLFFIHRYKIDYNYNNLIVASFFGGAALSTKLTFLLFLPGLIFLELPPINIDKI